MNTDDTALGDTTTDAPTPGHTAPAGGVFGDPTAHDHDAHPRPTRSWTIADILESAKLPEKYARVCIRADLQARHDQILAELSTLVDPNGEVLGDPDAALGDTTKAARAQHLSADLSAVEQEMRDSMWFPLFRGLSQDALAVFNEKHAPKKLDANGAPSMKDLREYQAILIAECAVEPPMSVEDVKALRTKLGTKAYGTLYATANEVCTKGGVDAGKSPAFLRNLQDS